jgi:hypothetical protein
MSQLTSLATVTVRCSMRPWPLFTSVALSSVAGEASSKKVWISERGVGWLAFTASR